LAKTRSALRGRRPQQQHHHQRSPQTPELHRSPETRFLDAAAVDLTIVRPAAAAPPRRLEQVAGSTRPSRSTKKNSIKRNGDGGQQAAPAGGSDRGAHRSAPPRTRVGILRNQG